MTHAGPKSATDCGTRRQRYPPKALWIFYPSARLDAAKPQTMEWHAEIGAGIVAAIGLTGAPQGALAIRHDHQHFDGAGCPEGPPARRYRSPRASWASPTATTP